MENNLSFNEKFGLGTSLLCGEENIFLLDCTAFSPRVKNLEEDIVSHPCRDEERISFRRKPWPSACWFKDFYVKN